MQDERAVAAKPRIPPYWWPVWMLLLALGLLLFYIVLTPGWMAIRAVAWLSERRAPREATPDGHGRVSPDRPLAPTARSQQGGEMPACRAGERRRRP